MEAEAYLKDPCGASSLPFWKTEQMRIPPGVTVCREDHLPAGSAGEDERYFRLWHSLQAVPCPPLPEGYALSSAAPAEFAAHIRECYGTEGITAAAAEAWTRHAVYDGDLWIVVRDLATGRIAASGIGEADRRIGEGILEWIQVSPWCRRKGLGRFTVCELLRRLRGKADFVTVSGRAEDPNDPLALYLSCGFSGPVIWHIIRNDDKTKK